MVGPEDQAKLIQFLNQGKGLYIEGTAFAYNNNGTGLFTLFGCTLASPGTDDNDNLISLTGQSGSIAAGRSYTYLANSLPNYWVGEIEPDGGTIIFRCDEGAGRGVTCEGTSGAYRALHTSVLFGAIRGEGARDTLMKVYMDYLLGNTPCIERRPGPFAGNSLMVCPLSRSGRLNFTLSRPARVAVDLYNIAGRRLCRFINAKFAEGSHQLSLPKIVHSGTYIVRLATDTETANTLIIIPH